MRIFDYLRRHQFATMAGKKKKDKKSTETKETLSAVDQTFFEITINDLNNKLAHLRTHNAKLEQRNEELESEMAQLSEDRADVTAFLNRSLHTQAGSLKDLEEKLSELSKVRQEETENFQSIIKGWEVKYKAMNDQLSSEIKLLNGKLNSLEEFRIQKDELMTKFDQQEQDLKDQNHRHKVTIYELERKQIIDKDRLKKEVENKLIQLSNEFRKSNEIRIASHVQRLVRENIALNNELDCLLVTHRRMETERQTMLERYKETQSLLKALKAENFDLSTMCEHRYNIIRELQKECQVFRSQQELIDQTDTIRKLAETRETTVRKELNEFKTKMMDMQHELDTQRSDCQLHSARAQTNNQIMEQLFDTLKQVRHVIMTAVNFDQTNVSEVGAVFTEVQRKNILTEMENILTYVKDIDVSHDAKKSNQKSSKFRSLYKKGTVGILPKAPTSSSFKFNRQSYRTALPNVMGEILQPQTSDLEVCEVIDVGHVFGSKMSTAESMGSTELLKE